MRLIILALTLLTACSLSAASKASSVPVSSALQATIQTGPLLAIPASHNDLEATQILNEIKAHKNGARVNTPFNLGMTQGRFWLAFEVKNVSQKSQTLQLAIRAAFRPYLSADLIADNQVSTRILSDSHQRAFNERDTPYFRFLSSDPFTLASQHSAWIVLDYSVIGASLLPLEIVDPKTHLSDQISDFQVAVWFYSFSLAALLLFGLFGIAMANRIIPMYMLLFMLGLLLIAAIEGFAYQWLWPQYPAWNHYAALVIASLMTSLGFFIAKLAIPVESRQRWVQTLLLSVAASSLLLIPALFLFDFVVIAQITNVAILAMFIAQALSMSTWITVDATPNRLALFGALAVIAAAMILSVLGSQPAWMPEWLFQQANRLVFLFIMLTTIVLLSQHMRALHRRHERAMQQALESAKREAYINRSLYEAEQNYARASELANRRRQQLASASHDMKQPLVSLRATMDALMHNQPEQSREQLSNAFNYLDNLCNQYLRDSHPDTSKHIDQNATAAHCPDTQPEPQQYSSNLIIDTARRMFRDEAAAKGLELRSVPCSAMIDAPPTVIMRVVTNVLSNAIKHTQTGRILIGVRRQPGAISVQIHDTGPGMTDAQLDDLRKPYHKGPESAGSGLGLAICKQLAEENGLIFEIGSRPNHGSWTHLIIPSPTA